MSVTCDSAYLSRFPRQVPRYDAYLSQQALQLSVITQEDRRMHRSGFGTAYHAAMYEETVNTPSRAPIHYLFSIWLV